MIPKWWLPFFRENCDLKTPFFLATCLSFPQCIMCVCISCVEEVPAGGQPAPGGDRVGVGARAAGGGS